MEKRYKGQKIEIWNWTGQDLCSWQCPQKARNKYFCKLFKCELQTGRFAGGDLIERCAECIREVK